MTPEMGGASERGSFVARQTGRIKLKVGGRIRLGHARLMRSGTTSVTVKTGDGQETSIREGGDCPCRVDAVG